MAHDTGVFTQVPPDIIGRWQMPAPDGNEELVLGDNGRLLWLRDGAPIEAGRIVRIKPEPYDALEGAMVLQCKECKRSFVRGTNGSALRLLLRSERDVVVTSHRPASPNDVAHLSVEDGRDVRLRVFERV